MSPATVVLPHRQVPGRFAALSQIKAGLPPRPHNVAIMPDTLIPERCADAPRARPVFPDSLLSRLDRNGPRYTSYPTADRYHDGFGTHDYRQALAERAASRRGEPMSLYVHVPFCDSVCYYCACNKVVTRRHERAAPYLDALGQELALHVEALGGGEPVSHLHLGGGTPTFLSDAELTRLMAMLRGAFTLTPDAEVSIEVDPRTADRGRLAHLRGLGFNRLSFGVQDFDPRVQQAVHRVQPFEDVRQLMLAARELGFGSINVDLIYGLPHQTLASFARTVAQVGELRPDRIALYAYAHLPQRFAPQRRILAADLPDASARVGLLGDAIAGFLELGYVYIGMDHFALPDDALAVARREGRLHRNFQGYTAQPDGDLIALGVSAIGKVGNVYSQNVKTLDAYYGALAQARLPVERGLRLSADDEFRRRLIMDVMCRGRLALAELHGPAGEAADTAFGPELARLRELAGLGLVTLDAGVMQVTGLGWYFVRAVAMTFDRYLREAAPAASYSRIV